jgi:hypothetical protein
MTVIGSAQPDVLRIKVYVRIRSKYVVFLNLCDSGFRNRVILMKMILATNQVHQKNFVSILALHLIALFSV